MHADAYRRWQGRLSERGLLGASNLKGAATVASVAAATKAVLVGAALVPRWSLGFWLLLVGGAVLLFHWFVVLHECGHRTLFTKTAINTVVGHLASVFCLIPYYAWRNVHLLHHRWVGVIDKDPTQRHLLKLHEAGARQHAAFRIVWRLWIPIPFAKFLFEVFWGYANERRRAGDAVNARRGRVSIAACALPHLAAISIFGPEAWAAVYLPMLAGFYFLIENMNLPQHSELFPHLSCDHPEPIPLARQDAITRSTHLPDACSVLLALNFNRHTEHHLFVGAPWWALNKVRHELLAGGYVHPHEVAFLSFMRNLRRRDPVAIYRDALPRPGRVGGQPREPQS